MHVLKPCSMDRIGLVHINVGPPPSSFFWWGKPTERGKQNNGLVGLSELIRIGEHANEGEFLSKCKTLSLFYFCILGLEMSTNDSAPRQIPEDCALFPLMCFNLDDVTEMFFFFVLVESELRANATQWQVNYARNVSLR